MWQRIPEFGQTSRINISMGKGHKVDFAYKHLLQNPDSYTLPSTLLKNGTVFGIKPHSQESKVRKVQKDFDDSPGPGKYYPISIKDLKLSVKSDRKTMGPPIPLNSDNLAKKF